MYHCHVRFCLVGEDCELFDVVRETQPLKDFSHDIVNAPDIAEVIIANLSGPQGPAELESLFEEKEQKAKIILLAKKEEMEGFYGRLEDLWDVWNMPMGRREAEYRYVRWQNELRDMLEHWQSDQYLEATINSIPSLIWYKTRDGAHEKVNNSFCRTVNKTKEQVQGRHHAYIWDVDSDDPACIESEARVMEQEITVISEESVHTNDGTMLLTTYKSPLYDLDGSVMGTVGVGLDITQERAYQKELMAKSQTLESLFATIDCGIMLHSLDGKTLISVNPAALDILGYSSKDDMMADGFSMVASSVVDEDKAKLKAVITALKDPNDSVNVEYRVRHRDGKELHVVGNVKLVEEGGELMYQRFLFDNTARKLQAQRESEEKELRQIELIHALSIDYSMVCFFDVETGLGHALRISECQYGVLNDIFSGELEMDKCFDRYIDACVYRDDREDMRQALTTEYIAKVLEEHQTVFHNYRTACGNEMRYFQMKAVRAGSWEHQRGVVLGFRSVDEETRQEMEKKTILENALLQANRSSKAKTTFLSNMSHDIRTPMNAIVGFTNLALHHLDKRDQVEEYLKKIMTSGNHLLSLINDILDMSHIESGKIHLDEELCSLPDILHGLHSIILTDIRAKQLDFTIDTVDVLDEDIYCDRLRLNQVLLNLLSNAVKYTGAGGQVSMRITEKPGAPAGSAYYEFKIKDNGIGMSKEFVEHIFEPFERERNTTMSGVQGTGLGMAITKSIVDMMHGIINVESEQGIGTEFTVSLCFRLQAEAKEAQVIPELKDCRALVVDDDFNTCDSVSYMLQQIGLKSEWTLSGKEAILRTRQAVSRNKSFDVYILDWLMPDMNGVEVARRIRLEAGEDVSIVILTAYDWSDIEDEARDAGVMAFCRKPIFTSELRRCLLSVIGREPEKEEMMEMPPVLRSGRILLAEDNELNQEIAVAILDEAGVTTEIASNGLIAMEMLKASEPGYYDLVLMDVQMPVMGGYEATRAIRKLEDKRLANIPIFAMTANAFEEDKQMALECGMNGHISKPIDMNMLYKTIEKVLGKE